MDRTMNPFLITIPGGVSRENAMVHEGEEFLHVQSGSVQFEYDGEIVSLRAGDSLYFDANIPHRLINPNKRPAEALCVFSGRSLESPSPELEERRRMLSLPPPSSAGSRDRACASG
jgi:mannose-6-phosphate isomerase-like protein (cupin superfamily)